MEKVKLLLNSLIRDQSSQILTRSKIKAAASRLNFSETKKSFILLACSEIMTNQLKFATGAGIIQIWEHKSPEHALDIFGYDMGPGIENLSKAISDGYSTSNTLGHGLGSVIRSSDLCEIYTKNKKKDKKDIWTGTAVWCRFYPKTKKINPQKIKTGIFIRALNDDIFNGDYIDFDITPEKATWVHIDGLGHGKSAYKTGEIASEIAIDKLSPEKIIKTLNSNLLGKRMANGLAISLDNKGNFIYSGYGDVAFKIFEGNPKLKSIHLQNKTIGENLMEINCNSSYVNNNNALITFSDGIHSGWNLEHYPGLLNKHPQLAAYLLGNIFSRRNDDKSLFIAKYEKE
jgi:anti-sigma regulatory factor (Ser/Thr protein kinase)